MGSTRVLLRKGDVMGRRWLGSFLLLAGVGGLALLPRPAHPTTCDGPLDQLESLRLEPVSLEVGGVQVEGWVEDTSDVKVSLSRQGFTDDLSVELASQRPPYDDSYYGSFREVFDANPAAGR